MERVKQALEQARRERQRRRGVAISTPPKDQSTPVAGTPIRYTQTRTIKVSAQALKERRVVAAENSGALAKAYTILHTRILQRMRAKGWTSLAITSAAKSNGKTLTAVNLAISMSHETSHTVLLVDLNLHSPGIAAHFTDEPLPGLSDYLLNAKPLNEILFNPGIDRLVVLPGNKPLANSAQVLSSPAMVGLVEELRTRYASRLIIFDIPALTATDEVVACFPYTDAVLLVIEEGRTRKDELARVPKLLHGTRLLGTVLNKSADPITAYHSA